MDLRSWGATGPNPSFRIHKLRIQAETSLSLARRVWQLLPFLNNCHTRHANDSGVSDDSRIRPEFVSCEYGLRSSSSLKQRLEGVQRSFTRHLAFISSGISHRCPYEYRLNYFHMPFLKNRRQIHHLVLLHKIVNGQVRCNDLTKLIALQVPHRLPRYPVANILHVPFSRTNVGTHSPIVKMCQLFNNISSRLPDIDIFHLSPTGFRHFLEKHVV